MLEYFLLHDVQTEEKMKTVTETATEIGTEIETEAGAPKGWVLPRSQI